ncbi:MAG TPA: beta-ketoacyl-ACP synthase II [Herpetosiphonaceae bacterium]|nr:beta-ketoacyl-ACP synthase II [Herpetosiphonaceae bacterium]
MLHLSSPRARAGVRVAALGDEPVILPAPLEQQLEAIVEDVIGDEPLVQPLPQLIDERSADQRVVVTGIGVVSPVGIGLDQFWDGISHGRSGIDYFTQIPNFRAYPSQIGAEVKGFEPREFIDFKEARRMSRMTQFAVASARMALEDSGLGPDRPGDDIAVVIGCGGTAFPETEQTLRLLLEKGGSKVSPFYIPTALPNMPACQIAIQLGLRGANSTITTACAASSQAIGEAAELLLRSDAEVVLAGGTEAPICELTLAGFCAMRALSSAYNDEPHRASRPFDAGRDGFVAGEGAAVLVLETLARAQARGARIYAELIGYGASADAYHVTAPDPVGQGAARAIQRAMRRARITPQQIDYINAHATSTPAGDAAETLAIKAALGEYASTVAISSTKSMIGHLTGAAGAVESVATIMALKHGLIPPTINYETPDPACDLDYVPNVARPAAINIALSNSFGFGGQNATLAFRKWDDRRLSPGEMALEAEIESRLDEQ